MIEVLCNVADIGLNNIKDVINISFWVFTIIVAWKTYRNAKKTLFNPIRGEMIKYQLKLITDFIDSHTSPRQDFDTSIDYSNLLMLNYETDYLLDKLKNQTNWETGAMDEMDRSKLQYCKENLGGLFEISRESDRIILQPVAGDFDTVIPYLQTTFIKEKEEEHKKLHLQRFYFTKRFFSFYNDLRNLNDNPFVPDYIKIHTLALTDSIYENVGQLYALLSKHIGEQTDTSYQNIYSQFEKVKINHEADLDSLKKAIAAYFRVNQT